LIKIASVIKEENMQVVLNGLISGLTIALLAQGFAIVYITTKTFHIAIAGIYAAVPFIALACLNAGFHWTVVVLLTMITAFVLSVSCELVNHHPLRKKNASEGAHLISSLGIYIILVQVLALIWGSDVRALKEGIDGVFKIMEMKITHTQAIAAGVSLFLIISFYSWLKFTRVGLKFRALVDNPKEFALKGYNAPFFRVLAFGIAGIFCAAASLVTSYDIGFDPYVGLGSLFPAIVAFIIGGQDSFLGPLWGGLIIGLIRSNVVWFFSSKWEEAITLLILAIFLYARPQGLISKKVRLEAAK
jgi:branched-chain amino acid transport system permease protein